MPVAQWTITELGLFAATLGLFLMAVLAHEARRRRWLYYGLSGVVVGAATVVFALVVTPGVEIG